MDDRTTHMTIGEMLYEARLRKGAGGKLLPVTQAAEQLGVGGRQTYYHWEKDYSVPSLERAQAIADFCEVPVERVVSDILRRKGVPTYEEYLSEALNPLRIIRIDVDGDVGVEDAQPKWANR